VAKILVTDGEHRSALAVVRSLGQAGHEVSVCSVKRRPLAGASRYCRASFSVTDPLGDVARFRKDVSAIDGGRFDLVIPTTDVSTVALSSDPGWRGPRVAAPEPATYFAVSDKEALLGAAAGLGLHVPAQLSIPRRGERAEEVLAWARERAFDVALKPARSVVLAEPGLRKFSVRIVRSEADLRDALDAYPPEAYPLLMQDRVSGPGLGVFMLTRRGVPIASFAHRRIREKPPTGGVSVYSESVLPRADVLSAAQRILAHYAWSGVAMVEFKEDARTGTPYLMEVNGRFWGSLQLAIDAGVDFPTLLVRMEIGELDAPVGSYRVGIRSRWLWGDFDHLLWVLHRGRRFRDAFPQIPSGLGALRRFLSWTPGDRFDVLRAADLGPFLRESMDWVTGALGRSR